jgi:hypothetical protein
VTGVSPFNASDDEAEAVLPAVFLLSAYWTEGDGRCLRYFMSENVNQRSKHCGHDATIVWHQKYRTIIDAV